MKRNFVALSDSSPGYREIPLEWLPAHTDRVFDRASGSDCNRRRNSSERDTQLRFVERSRLAGRDGKAVKITR